MIPLLPGTQSTFHLRKLYTACFSPIEPSTNGDIAEGRIAFHPVNLLPIQARQQEQELFMRPPANGARAMPPSRPIPLLRFPDQTHLNPVAKGRFRDGKPTCPCFGKHFFLRVHMLHPVSCLLLCLHML